MYFLYIDESGYSGGRLDNTNQPVLAMAGLLVNQYHWRKSWEGFKQFCDEFRDKFGVDFKELKAADVYAGRGKWSNISHDRQEILEFCLNWLKGRPHKIIATAIIKKALKKQRSLFQQMLFPIKNDVSKLSLYFLSALHLSLIFQRYLENQRQDAYKKIGMIIFDDQKQEQNTLLDLLTLPPKSVAGFTNKISSEGFCCIMDNTYFIGSHHSSFIQLADIVSFVIRKTVEFEIGYKEESYEGEKNKIVNWFSTIKDLFIEKKHRFPTNCEIVKTYKKIILGILQ
ncbi:MAG: hypothetical protein B5M53_11495 [Candidatus Cloacimonas sp. 4484_209]|nr:MAG: hypothetical protein B5M53_11495 [Candidatus Cloacimonas sp. 4484_209]